MIRISRFGVAIVLFAILLAGCNTVAGAGKDVQKAGEKLEEAAK
ncbi:MAG TPA: entericidin A/B family lipoprotein [Thermomonas sp.]|nr:entericidin A/B family lipoprotein [Thermomonas sp.]